MPRKKVERQEQGPKRNAPARRNHQVGEKGSVHVNWYGLGSLNHVPPAAAIRHGVGWAQLGLAFLMGKFFVEQNPTGPTRLPNNHRLAIPYSVFASRPSLHDTPLSDDET